MTPSKSFVDSVAESICAQYPASAMETVLAVVSAVATRQRLAAVRDYSRGKEPRGASRQDQVIAVVCRHFGLTVEELKSPSRKPRLVEARATAWHLLRTELRMSSSAVGRLFERHHTTVLQLTSEMNLEELAVARELASRLRAQWDVAHVEAAE